MEVLAKRLKWLRERKRLSQKEVAAEIGMKTVNGYQKIEMDERNPKLDVLIKLAEIFEVSTDFLLGVTDLTKDIMKVREKATNNKQLLIVKKSFYDLYYHDESQSEEFRKKVMEEYNEARVIYHQILIEYITRYIAVPGFDYRKDDLISHLFPISFEVEKDLFGYAVNLLDKEGHSLGRVAYSQTPGDKNSSAYESMIVTKQDYENYLKNNSWEQIDNTLK